MNFFRLAGIVPLGIGLTVLGFMWLSSFDGFGSPPLFFRIFFSFIALGFVLKGVGILFTSPATLIEQIKAGQKALQDSHPTSLEMPSSPPSPGKLKCPNCGSSPQTGEVSPLGDVKCDHCSRWYNVHTA